jgi:hypothetical protein
MHPDRLAELEEERRFLLRSIDDLEREHRYGDVTDEDYRTLLDGYTARAAAVLRSALPSKRRRRPGVLAAWIVGTVLVATIAGVLVARSSGQRLPGQVITGGQEIDDVTATLSQASALLATDPFAAAELYRQVLVAEPTNVEARTYLAWLLVLNASGVDAETAALAIDTALADFRAVIDQDPGYADARCLYAVAVGRFIPEPDLDLARSEAEACLALDPPRGMVGLIEGFLGTLTTDAP